MKRSAGRWWRSSLAASALTSLVLVSSGCRTSVGISPADIPPCPQSVIDEAWQGDDLCWPEDVLSDLTNHCEALEVLRE